MGGIIVVDFIDMNSSKNRKLLFEKMREYMKGDKAKHHILPPTKFGLVQITRQRVRPEMNIDTREDCPMCIGNGKIDSSLLLIDTIENKIKNLIDKSDNGKIRISTHPFIASHINKGIFSKGVRWSLKFKRIIQIVPDERLHLLQYSIVKK
jgi:ribonuclease G